MVESQHRRRRKSPNYLSGVGCRAKVDGLAGGEQAEAMEELEHLAARLVHHGDDGHPLPGGEAGDAAHHVVRDGAVEPAGGLVQEEQPRAREDLEADAEALPLPAADALGLAPADARVQCAGEPHLLDRVAGAGELLGDRHGVRQLDLRRVVDCLAHRQGGHQHVLLRHVRLDY